MTEDGRPSIKEKVYELGNKVKKQLIAIQIRILIKTLDNFIWFAEYLSRKKLLKIAALIIDILILICKIIDFWTEILSK